MEMQDLLTSFLDATDVAQTFNEALQSSGVCQVRTRTQGEADNKASGVASYGPGGPYYPGGQVPQGYQPCPPGTYQGNKASCVANYGPGGPYYPGQVPQGYQPCPPGTYQAPPGQPGYGFQVHPGVIPVATQPGVPMWMPTLVAPQNCPPGLEYLSQIDHILIHQQVELLQVLTGFEMNNKYEIKNALGQRVYFAAEENDCCTRMVCGPARSFVISVIDNTGRPVMKLHRPYRCSSCFCPCCLQKLEVQAPPGTTVGYVIQNCHPCLPKFTVQNEKKEAVLRIIGPCVPCSCCGDVNFEVKSLDKSQDVGRIAFTDGENFGIQFPTDLDVKIKAALLGACFLIDYMFFEHKQDNC